MKIKVLFPELHSAALKVPFVIKVGVSFPPRQMQVHTGRSGRTPTQNLSGQGSSHGQPGYPSLAQILKEKFTQNENSVITSHPNADAQ